MLFTLLNLKSVVDSKEVLIHTCSSRPLVYMSWPGDDESRLLLSSHISHDFHWWRKEKVAAEFSDFEVSLTSSGASWYFCFGASI